MDRSTIPPSVIRQPPPPPPPIDSNMLTKTTMQSKGKRGRSNSSSTARSVRRKTELETNIESLPDELLFDILVRLPAVFLHGRARHVCHKWSHIIQSRDFINAHSQQHSTYGLVLSLQTMYQHPHHPHSIYVTAAQGGRLETSAVTSQSYLSMATSCNGLTLQVRRHNAKVRAISVHVINPATNQSFRLPKVVLRSRRVFEKQCGIAYSAASMEYKVTVLSYSVVHGNKLCFLDILTVGVDKSWRRVVTPQDFPTHVSDSSQVPLSSEGFLHWGSRRCCLTLNVETEMFTMTEVPIPPDQSDHYLYYYLSTGRYLTLLVRRRGEFSWEVWEMKPAESGEWRKAGLPKIQLEAQTFQFLNPIGWVKYPEVLAFAGLYQTTCIFYNLETHEIEKINLFDHLNRYNKAFVHRISLARPCQD